MQHVALFSDFCSLAPLAVIEFFFIDFIWFWMMVLSILTSERTPFRHFLSFVINIVLLKHQLLILSIYDFWKRFVMPNGLPSGQWTVEFWNDDLMASDWFILCDEWEAGNAIGTKLNFSTRYSILRLRYRILPDWIPDLVALHILDESSFRIGCFL